MPKYRNPHGYPPPSKNILWTAKAKRPPKQPSKLDIVLDSSNVVLSTLYDAARLTPVPYLQDAAAVALRIVTIIQGVKSNKDGFRRLATDACALVYILLCSGDKTVGLAAVTPTYLDHARDLADTLHEIYNYTKTQASRNYILRMVQYMSDAGMILEYRERLKQSLDEFSLKSSISIQDTLAAIQQQLAHVASQTKDLHEGEVRRQGSLLIEEQQRASARGVDEAAESEQAAEKVTAKKEEVEQKMAEKERIEGERNDLNRIDRERLKADETKDREDTPHQLRDVRATPSVSTSNPFRQQIPLLPGLQSMPPASDEFVSGLKFPPGLYATSGLQFAHPKRHFLHGSFTSVGGDQTIYSGGVINTNSGNTTTNVVSNSNNDSSVRIYERRGSRR